LVRLAAGVGRIVQWGAWFGGALLILAVLAIAAEVIMRNVAGRSFGAVDELSGYALAIASTWGFAYALFHRTHIRIDAAYLLLPRRVQAGLDLLAMAGMIAFFGFVARYGWDLLVRSASLGQRAMTPLRTPLIIPQVFWYAGLVALIVVAVVLFLVAANALRRGDMQSATRAIGSRSAEEELEEELADTRRRQAQVPAP
jgi:TRAP-type C4-dicarboxylate transport system permease small subunit